MMTRRSCLRSAGAFALAGLGAPAFAQLGNRLVIGHSAALTGPASAPGEQFKLGAQLGFQRANARGGIGGR